MYPKLEGRFLQVGGMSFAFDPTKPPLQRVDPRFVRIGDQYLELHTKYRMVTKAYMIAGKDGFDVMKKLKILVRHVYLKTKIAELKTDQSTSSSLND